MSPYCSLCGYVAMWLCGYVGIVVYVVLAYFITCAENIVSKLSPLTQSKAAKNALPKNVGKGKSKVKVNTYARDKVP